MDRSPGSILFILEHFHPYVGGVETMFFHLARELVLKGVRVEVLTTRHQANLPLQEEIEGVILHRVRSRNRFGFTLRALPSAIRLARHCDIIHTTTYNAAVPAFMAGLLVRKKVVITVHEVWNHLWFEFPWMNIVAATSFYLFERMLLRLPFTRFVAVSDATAASMLSVKIPAKKITTIYNGVDYSKLAALKSASPVAPSTFPDFVYFGRLGHSKGIDLILAGGDRFLSGCPEGRIELIVPAVPARFLNLVKRKIDRLSNPERFTITHSLPATDLFTRVIKCTAVLIPSYSEGFCYAASEATALGIPMISSDKGALRETAGGKVVTMSGMTPEAMCQALQSAIEGDFDIRPCRSFPLKGQVQQYLNLYNTL